MPTALYGAETWSMAVAKKRLNVIEMSKAYTAYTE